MCAQVIWAFHQQPVCHLRISASSNSTTFSRNSTQRSHKCHASGNQPIISLDFICIPYPTTRAQQSRYIRRPLLLPPNTSQQKKANAKRSSHSALCSQVCLDTPVVTSSPSTPPNGQLARHAAMPPCRQLSLAISVTHRQRVPGTTRAQHAPYAPLSRNSIVHVVLPRPAVASNHNQAILCLL